MPSGISDLFNPVPSQWGLRGDPYLWDEMRKSFKNEPTPASDVQLSARLEQAFEKLKLHPLAFDGPIFIERFSHGGMSSGHVSAAFWREKAIPLLVSQRQSVMTSATQATVCAWVSVPAFFGSAFLMLIERRAFDKTLGEMSLVGIGLSIGILLSIPCVVLIRRLAFKSADRWAVCAFLTLGLCCVSVTAATYANHHFGADQGEIEPLPVLDKKFVVLSRNAGSEYWLSVRVDDQQKWILINSADWESVKVGGMFTTEVKRGWLDLPVIACHDCY